MRITLFFLTLFFVSCSSKDVTYHNQNHMICVKDGTCYEGD